MKKRILFIMTGGTIASVQTASGLTPMISPEELISYLPEIRDFCTPQTYSLCSIDSTNMSAGIWLDLVRVIEENYSLYDGFIICHGTDTLAYTAAVLSYLIRNSRKPIILTGAQKPISFEITDAKKNLRDSVLVATDYNSWGVMVVFDGSVIAGTRAKKVKSYSYDAFKSINCPELAHVHDRSLVRYLPSPRPEDEVIFDYSLSDRVFLLKLTPAMPIEILAAIYKQFDCLVVESFGVGGLPDPIADELDRLQKEDPTRECILVMGTQVTYEGSNVETYRVGNGLKDRFHLLETHDMTLESVMAKLKWLLGKKDHSYETVKAGFYHPINYDTFHTQGIE